MSRLTQREFLWLDDVVNAAQLESKCFVLKAQQCQDASIKDLFSSCAQMHQRHFERLARYITSVQAQTVQSNPAVYYQTQGQYGQPGYSYGTPAQGFQSVR